MRLRLAIVLLAVCAVASTAHAAKLYKWIDKNGNVSYHDQPPPSDDYKVEEKEMKGGGAVSSANQEAAGKFPVVLYMTPKCSSCDAARAYLKGRGVPFKEKNVQTERALQEELMKLTGGELAVPTVMVGKKTMRGFLESLLEDELTEAGYAKSGEDTEPAKTAETDQPQDIAPSK